MRLAKSIVAVLTLVSIHGIARGQAKAAGIQGYQLSAWAGATGTITGLNNGKNAGLSAGIDLGFRPFFHLEPSIELRGTYPVDEGSVIGERSLLVGLKVEKHFHRFHPYLDVLYGRGQIDYVQPLPNPQFTYFYIQTTSNVLSGGAGLDYAVTEHLNLKADVQLQQWATPVLANNHFESEPITVGVSYYIDFNRFQRHK